jgi:hypothetical protein
MKISLESAERGARMLAVAVLATVAVTAGAAPDAVAGPVTPLTITKFALQTTRSVPVGGPFTPENWGFANEPVTYTQAGGHLNGQGGGADALTATIEFESETAVEYVNNLELHRPVPTRDPKDIVVDLPTGLLGNPTALPRCPLTLVTRYRPCPIVTQVGVAEVELHHGEGFVAPIVDVEPEEGQSAEFAIESPWGINFIMTAHVVRAPEEAGKPAGYGITVVTKSIPIEEIYRVVTTFWGVPAASIHNPERGLRCNRVLSTHGPNDWGCTSPGGERSGEPETPFLTMPSDCYAGRQAATIRSDSWEEPGRVGVNGKYEGYVQEQSTMPGVTGCNLLGFAPEVRTEPDTLLADAPMGLGLDLVVPQPETPTRLATPEMRKSVIGFPSGVSISPSVVDGVQACNEFGPEGINFTGSGSEEKGVDDELQLAHGHCPNASTIGTAEAVTPLLSEPLKGHIFLARPACGGTGQSACTERDAANGDLYQLYLELGGEGQLANAGVNIKVRLKTKANPATGQLTAVAEEIAQLPFSELKVHLNGGPRAPLDNPAQCGQATTTADFTSWAAPGTTPEGVLVPGLADATPSSSYEVQGCSSSPGLAPAFVAGTVIPTAGKFSAFTLNLSRKDREQYVKGIQVHTPPGLLGMLSNVPLCPEEQANNPAAFGECTTSKIGTTRVASGAGSHPFEIEGNMYLTGPYEGAPFGLSIVTHAVAGPFNLGLVIVRARVNVDPVTSALTITTDETGPYALPQIIFGVPLRLQRIAVNVDRPNFMFNPTNCHAQGITATISGNAQALANVSSPFAASDCKSLAFKPHFTAFTSGHTSRTKGAFLDTRLSYPKNALGNDSNIASVRVELPRALPSRLSTLNHACPDSVFDQNPANCPPESRVGYARSTTPLLPVPVEGPAFFVSHGGKGFPDLIIVLQGDGVTVDLVGSTFINKAGITSSAFKTIPDVPVDSFELYLPEGKYSALAANRNLCQAAQTRTRLVKRKVRGRLKGRTVTRIVTKRIKSLGLVMPTELVAQYGAVLKQNTPIAVQGCAAPKMRKPKKPTHPKGRK